MESIYHPGEIRMQREAGATALAAATGRQVLPVIAHLYVDFIQRQPYVFIGAAGAEGMAWGSILSGGPGLMRVMDERTLWIGALPHGDDPICGNFRDGIEVGLLLLDFSTRRRLRINGSVTLGEGGFSIQTRQVYANCTRYIQSRRCESGDDGCLSLPRTQRTTALTPQQREWIGKADTFFIASYHPQGGADLSHRGGYPGFVQAVDGSTIIWPEYNGNGMFNTLGNILDNPASGLLFLDFEKGGTIQLSGSAGIIQDRERTDAFPGAERIVEFRIGEIVLTENATPLRWSFMEYSPDNPWFC